MIDYCVTHCTVFVMAQWWWYNSTLYYRLAMLIYNFMIYVPKDRSIIQSWISILHYLYVLSQPRALTWYCALRNQTFNLICSLFLSVAIRVNQLAKCKRSSLGACVGFLLFLEPTCFLFIVDSMVVHPSTFLGNRPLESTVQSGF